MFSLLRAKYYSAQVNANRKLEDEEASPLFNDDNQQESDHSSVSTLRRRYGSTDTSPADPPGNDHLSLDDRSASKQQKDRREETTAKEDTHWFTYLRQYGIVIPYVWPTGNLRLQLHLVGIVLSLVVIRFLNVLAPRQLGIVINSFETSSSHMPVADLLLYVFLDWLTTSSVMGSIKNYLWLSVEQNAHKAIVTATFNHIMGLSCSFHDSKKSGELYKSMSQGSSIYTLFEDFLFDLLPMLVDLVFACVYLSYLFGSYMALLVSTTTVIYLCSLRYLAAKQMGLLRDSTAASRKEDQVLYDAMGSWISVAYFNNFQFEKERYTDAIAGNLKTRFKYQIVRLMTRMLQDSILKIGFVAATLVAAYQVSIGTITVGSFVLLLDYWSRFTGRGSDRDPRSCHIKLTANRSAIDLLLLFAPFARQSCQRREADRVAAGEAQRSRWAKYL